MDNLCRFCYIYSAALALHNINGEPFSVTFVTAGKLLNLSWPSTFAAGGLWHLNYLQLLIYYL